MALFERSERAPRKEMDRLAKRINDLRVQLTNPYAVTKALGETLVAQTVARFDSKKGPDEKTWAPWSANYARTRKAGDSLLIDNSTHDPSGPHLRDSFHPQIEAGAVTVSTEVKYALFVNKRRPFIGLSRANVSELEQVMLDVLASLIEQKPAKGRKKSK